MGAVFRQAFYGRCLLTQRDVCAVYNYAGKRDLSKDHSNPERMLGLTMYFSEIIKLQ